MGDFFWLFHVECWGGFITISEYFFVEILRVDSVFLTEFQDSWLVGYGMLTRILRYFFWSIFFWNNDKNFGRYLSEFRNISVSISEFGPRFWLDFGIFSIKLYRNFKVFIPQFRGISKYLYQNFEVFHIRILCNYTGISRCSYGISRYYRNFTLFHRNFDAVLNRIFLRYLRTLTWVQLQLNIMKISSIYSFHHLHIFSQMMKRMNWRYFHDI